MSKTENLNQAWDILLKSGVSLEQYTVFSVLSRLGYRVVRHNMAQKLPQVVSLEPGASSTTVRPDGESSLNTSLASCTSEPASKSDSNNDEDIEIVEIEQSPSKEPFESKDTKSRNKSSKSFMWQICADIIDTLVVQAAVTSQWSKEQLDYSADSSEVSYLRALVFFNFEIVLSTIF